MCFKFCHDVCMDSCVIAKYVSRPLTVTLTFDLQILLSSACLFPILKKFTHAVTEILRLPEWEEQTK